MGVRRWYSTQVVLLLPRHPLLYIFQQDDAWRHTAINSTDCIDCIRPFLTHLWLTRLPDIYPIEKVWDLMTKHLGSFHDATNLIWKLKKSLRVSRRRTPTVHVNIKPDNGLHKIRGVPTLRWFVRYRLPYLLNKTFQSSDILAVSFSLPIHQICQYSSYADNALVFQFLYFTVYFRLFKVKIINFLPYIVLLFRRPYFSQHYILYRSLRLKTYKNF